MSVLIKGMKMPHSCSDCDYAHVSMFYHCIQNNIWHRDCAYVELPEKHGRLVDADALIAKCGDWYTEEGKEEGFIGTLEMLLKNVPTVVEAEGENEK